jgi:hypothetical protein
MATSKKNRKKKKKPEYVEWRSDLLAELALARIPGLKAYKLTDQEPFDKLAVTEDGFCFFVISRGFSSFASGEKDADARSELSCSCDADMLARAHQNQSPVVFFYFNADTDHGRYLRLDTLHETNAKELRFPIANTITKASMQGLIREMQATPRTSRAS